MAGYYVVRPGGVIESVESIYVWGEWYEKSSCTPFEDGGRRIARDYLPGGVEVSTVFLALDHCGGNFETMIFNGPHAGYQRRYATAEGARVGHAEAVALAKGEG